MMPAMLHGVGAVHRLRIYGAEKYKDLGYGDYTGPDLARWHNLFVSFYSGEKVPGS
jgi:hypothetical protein